MLEIAEAARHFGSTFGDKGGEKQISKRRTKFAI